MFTLIELTLKDICKSVVGSSSYHHLAIVVLSTIDCFSNIQHNRTLEPVEGLQMSWPHLPRFFQGVADSRFCGVPPVLRHPNPHGIEGAKISTRAELELRGEGKIICHSNPKAAVRVKTVLLA